jgi:hypothetical protein
LEDWVVGMCFCDTFFELHERFRRGMIKAFSC